MAAAKEFWMVEMMGMKMGCMQGTICFCEVVNKKDRSKCDRGMKHDDSITSITMAYKRN